MDIMSEEIGINEEIGMTIMVICAIVGAIWVVYKILNYKRKDKGGE